MKTLNRVLTIVTILSILFGMITSGLTLYYKSNAEMYENNLYVYEKRYKDDIGREILEKTQLQISVKELKQISKKDSTQLNGYEKRLKRIATELQNSKRKTKNLESALMIELETNFELSGRTVDTVIQHMEAKAVTFQDDFGKYDIAYIPETDSLYMALKQRNELFIDLFKERKRNKKGKKVLWLIRWIKAWEYKGSIKSMNSDTLIKEFDVVSVRKK